MKNKELVGHTIFTGAIGVLLLLRWLKVIETVFGVDVAIILTIVGGYKIFLEAITGVFKSIKNIEWDISADLAVAIAAIAALAIRQYTAAAEVIFIMIVGEGLELFGVVKTRGAIGKLMALSPQTACVKRDGVEERIPVEEVEPGDIVVVRQGERIPVDGEVVRGSSSVDQSTITGESMPVEKAVGDEAFTGTMNQFGVLEIETRSVGEDTVLGKIVHLVEEAQESKAPVERTVDRYARYFVPIVLTIAAIVFLITRDVTRSVAVLIVACPCSLILATPTAVVAGIGRLARSGILVKGGTYLEGIGKAECLAFDKTGTLTRGKPHIAEIVTFGNYEENDLLAVAAAAEQGSEHLLAELVVTEAQERNIHIPGADDFLMKPGMGVEARSGNRGILVGNGKLLLANSVEINPEVETDLDRLDSEGHTIVLVAVREAEDDYVVAGVIAIDDEIRPESASTISSLKSLGMDRFLLLTGDNERSAARIARQAGIDDVAANLLPDEKVSKIRELQKAGIRIAMVGDGVNDAPSLAVADVGIVMGGIGADVTMEAADIVLMADDLSKLSELVKLSRQAVKTIRQNILYFAIIFNGLALVAASVGLIGPVGAAIVHQIGSVMVVLNSLRLLITGGAKRGASWVRRTVDGLVQAVHSIPWRRIRRKLIISAAAVLVVLYIASGLYIIKLDEVGLIRRFGKLIRSDVPPGLHYYFPRPVGRITRLRINRISRVEIGFRTKNRETWPQQRKFVHEWNIEHKYGRYEKQREESLMIAGDENMLETSVVVHYVIQNPGNYLFRIRGIQDAEDLIRKSTEAAMCIVVGQAALDDILTSGRNLVEKEIKKRVQDKLDDYQSGLKIKSVRLEDIHPPVEVVDAFRDVASALEEKSKMENEAEAYSNEVTRLAAGEAKAEIENAAAYKYKKINSAVGESARFVSRLEASLASRDITSLRLYLEAVEESLSGIRKVVIDSRRRGKHHLYFLDTDRLEAQLLTELKKQGIPAESMETGETEFME